MTVKELIGYLEQCKPDYRVQTDCGYSYDTVVQVEDLTGGESYVELA